MARRSGSYAASAIVLVTAIFFLLTALHLGRREAGGGQAFSALFSSSEGLMVGADVDISGVPVGLVTAITLDRQADQSRVTFAVDRSIPVFTTASVRISDGGVGSGASLELTPGGGLHLLPPGSVLAKAWPAESLEEMIGSYIFGSGLPGSG